MRTTKKSKAGLLDRQDFERAELMAADEVLQELEKVKSAIFGDIKEKGSVICRRPLM
jgi:hypothetical protein